MTDEQEMKERQQTAKDDDVDIEGTVMKILGKQQPDEAVGMLLKDNYKQRDRMRRLSEERDRLKAEKEALEAKDPEDNTEELAKLAKWQELGSYEDVTGSLSALQELESDKTLQEVADVAEMDWKVLKDLDKLNPDIVLSVQDGKPVVKQDDTVTPLDDFAETNWSQYLPSLRKTKGTTYVQQTSGNQGSKGTDTVSAFIQGKREAKDKGFNPLKSPQQ